MTSYIGSYRIKPAKPVGLALTTIYGVGLGRARFLQVKSGAHTQQRMRHTTRHQRKKWFNLLKRRFALGLVLKTLKRANIKRLKFIKCYRGLRHGQFLPVRGQRTHSNRRTSRYLGSGTWQYVPSVPASKIKKVSKYIRHKPGLVERSNTIYNKLLARHFVSLQKDKRYFKQLNRQGKLGQFAKLAKHKTTAKKGAKK
jgi:small subunit ribosomal protein S13